MSKKVTPPRKSRATLPTKPVTCLYCMYTWNYRGNSFNNICCPRCKNRFDITKGKGLHFNNMINKMSELELQLNEIKAHSQKSDCVFINGEVDDKNQ